MQKFVLAIAVIGITAVVSAESNSAKSASPVPAPQAASNQQSSVAATDSIGQRLNTADADKDGKVSLAEAQKAVSGLSKERFDAMDANHDGFLTQEERAQLDEGEGRALVLERLKAADTDKDGKVSFDEAQKAFPMMTKEKFNRRDANQDGFLTPEERQEPGGPREHLGSADLNKDGKITLEEAQKTFPSLDEGRFKRMDTNGDGVITAEDRPQRRNTSVAHGRRGGEFAPAPSAK